MICPVCNRPMIPGPSTTAHHLIPKVRGGKIAEPVHQVCHGKIHATWNENQLRDIYNNWESIRTAPEIQPFIAWVRKKPEDYMEGTKMKNGHSRRKR